MRAPSPILLLSLSLIRLTTELGAQDPSRDGALEREAWRVTDFAADAGLHGTYVMHAAAEPDGGLWLATGDGLRHYDGWTWRRFDEGDGLPSRFVRTVCRTARGELWVGTDRGVARYDGTKFHDGGSGAHLPGTSVRRIVEDPDGSIWFCCDRWPRGDGHGGLARLRGDEWRSFGVRDGLPSDYVSDLRTTRSGRRFALTNKGLAEWRDGTWTTVYGEVANGATDYVWTIAELDDGMFVGAGTRYWRHRERQWQELPLPDAAHVGQLARSWLLRDGSLVTFCSDVRVDQAFVWRDGGWRAATPPRPGTDASIEHVEEAADGSLWVCGFGTLMHWARHSTEWSWLEDRGRLQCVDRGNRVWFEHDAGVRFHDAAGWHDVETLGGPLLPTATGVLGRNGRTLLHWRPDAALREFQDHGFAALHAHAVGRDGSWWIVGADETGALHLGRRQDDEWQRLVPLPPNATLVALAATDATRATALVRRGDVVIAVCTTPTAARHFEIGQRVTTIGEPTLFDAEGSYWLLGLQGLFRGDRSGEWRPVDDPPGNRLIAAFENASGTWFASRGTTGGRSGLSRFAGDAWRHFDIPVAGLVGRADDGSAYLATAGGRLCIVPPHDAPFELDLPLRLRVRRVVRDGDGTLWIDTDRGCLLWRPGNETPRVEPLAGSRHGPLRVPEGSPPVLLLTGQRRFRPRTGNERYDASVRLGAGPWTEFQPLSAEGIRLQPLPPGRHEVSVRLRDATGAITASPTIWTLQVLATPLQSRWWFWPAVAALLSLLGLAGGAAMRTRALRRSLAARLRAEDRHRTLVQNSPIGIFELDGRGCMLTANPAALALLRPEQEIGTTPLLTDALGLDAEQFQSGFERAARGRRADLQLSTASGAQLQLVLSPIAGHTDRILCVVQDVTERAALAARLNYAQKLEAVGLFAGGVAHDFNNLLTAVLGNVGLLRLGPLHADAAQPARSASPPETEELLREIEIASQRGMELTRQLLTFARRAPEGVTHVRAREELDNSVALLERLLPETVELRVDRSRAPDEAHVALAAGQFSQIVLNLGRNAADAMPGGGRLEITLEERRVDARRPLLVGDLSPGSYVVLVVRDHGPGIASDALTRIFEPFFSTKPLGQGTGLGLAIVHGIVERARGGIEVASPPTGGAEFRIWLPLVEHHALQAPPKVATGPGARGDETILVAEDQDFVRRLVVRVLQHAGYEILETADGADAIGAAEKHAGEIHLLLTDIVMPRLGGRDLARWFATHRPTTRVLFMSGYDDSSTTLPAGTLQKPFTTDALLHRVRRELDARKPAG
jgi:PAS domain S-box-containing protein